MPAVFRSNGVSTSDFTTIGSNTTCGGNNGMFGTLGNSPSLHVNFSGSAYVFEGAKKTLGNSVTVHQFFFRFSSTANLGNGNTIYTVCTGSDFNQETAPIRIEVTAVSSSTYKFAFLDPSSNYAYIGGSTTFNTGMVQRLVLYQTSAGWYLYVNNGTTPEISYAKTQAQVGYVNVNFGTLFQNGSGSVSGGADYGEIWLGNMSSAPSTTAGYIADIYQGYLQNHLALSGQAYRNPADGQNGSYANGYIDTVSETIAYIEMLAVQMNDQATLILVDNWVLANLLRKNSTAANTSTNAAPTTYLNLMCFKYNSANTDGKGIGTIYDANFATDADIERAQALLWAHARYGSSSSIVGSAGELTTPNYLQRALTVIGELRGAFTSYNSMQYLWNDVYQTGTTIQMGGDYHAPAAFKLFAQYDTANATFWSQAISGAYDVHTKAANVVFSGASPAQSTTAKLNPDWYAFNTSTGAVSTSPSTYGDSDYSYNSFRIYQRLYDMYVWYADTNALTALRLPKSFFTSEWSANTKIRSLFKHDGTNYAAFENAIFLYAAYWVLYAGDTANTTASAILSNKLASRYSQQPYGSIHNEEPSSGSASSYGYYGQSWALRGYMTNNGMWVNYGQSTGVKTNLFFYA